MAAAVVQIPKMTCAIPHIPLEELTKHIDLLVDNLQYIKQLSTHNELSINIVSIIVGSFVCKVDFNNPSSQYPVPRNHECPALVQNLVKNPSSQISPAFLEHIRQNNIQCVNFNQYLFLIDPMYSREEYAIPYGLTSVFPSVMKNSIIAKNGFIQDELLPTPVEYNSLLETFIIPDNIDELLIDSIIEKFHSLGHKSLLINIMDCTSNTLRRLWIQNSTPNVYLAMPDCLARDNLPMYMPIITYSSANDIPSYEPREMNGFRWINWELDNELTSLYQLISPHTYTFLIHNYKRLVLETYFMPICKILGRMRITLEYKLDDTKSIVFSQMSFQEFKELWTHERNRFAPLFISFMDGYYKWNYYKFIDILLDKNYFNPEPSMQKILLSYLETHLKQLSAFFPDDTIPTYTDNERNMQSLITSYLNENDIH